MAKKRGNKLGTIFKRSDGRWVVELTKGRDPFTGKYQKITKYAASQREANQLYKTLVAELEAEAYTEPSKVTVDEFFRNYLYNYKINTVAPTTFDSYVHLYRHIQAYMGSVRLQALTADHIQQFINGKYEEGLSNSTVRHLHLLIRQTLRHGVKQGILKRNAAEHVQIRSLEKREACAFTKEEQKRLLRALQGEKFSFAILFALGTGLRRGEILALKYDDIDWDKGTCFVRRNLQRINNRDPGATAKTKLVLRDTVKSSAGRRLVPIPALLMNMLEAHRREQEKEKAMAGPAYNDQGLIFATPLGGCHEPRNYYRAFKRILTKAGIDHGSPHSTRHTYATNLLLQMGESSRTVQDILGHADAQTTMNIYCHPELGMKTAASEKMDGWIRELLDSGEGGGGNVDKEGS